MKFGDGNLIAFSSGLGDGLYATYAGLDSQGNVIVVVTDFMVFEEDNKTAEHTSSFVRDSSPSRGEMS